VCASSGDARVRAARPGGHCRGNSDHDCSAKLSLAGSHVYDSGNTACAIRKQHNKDNSNSSNGGRTRLLAVAMGDASPATFAAPRPGLRPGVEGVRGGVPAAEAPLKLASGLADAALKGDDGRAMGEPTLGFRPPRMLFARARAMEDAEDIGREMRRARCSR
jgi:hypothetical protein